MRPCDQVACHRFPCADVRTEFYLVPDVEVQPEDISIVLLSEAAPPDAADGYYAGGYWLFNRPRSRPSGTLAPKSSRSATSCTSVFT